ncbi:MAG: hypothetical protein JWO67_5922 [Streptosporangiaceae bacterium]|jgi:hypothetical protein|nr:hypothetical protein [Streptosporangiaceae bacterium]
MAGAGLRMPGAAPATVLGRGPFLAAVGAAPEAAHKVIIHEPAGLH